jgi:hypothetical protein
MRKITEDEFESVNGHGQGSSGLLYNRLMALAPGEGLEVLKKEWQVKYPPTTLCNRIMKKQKLVFKWKALPDRSGWLFLRVK